MLDLYDHFMVHDKHSVVNLDRKLNSSQKLVLLQDSRLLEAVSTSEHKIWFSKDLKLQHIDFCLKFNLETKQCILCEAGYLYDQNIGMCLKFYTKIQGGGNVSYGLYLFY